MNIKQLNNTFNHAMPMQGRVAVPLGPSGRQPQAAIKLDSQSLCVLFTDGTLGLDDDQESLDGSEYSLVYHRASDVRNGIVELDEGSSDTKTLKKLAIVLVLAYIFVYASTRSFIEGPLTELSPDLLGILVITPIVLHYAYQRFLFVPPSLKFHHSSNTNPYIIKLAKENTIIRALAISFLLGLGSWFVWDLTQNAIICDVSILLISLVYIANFDLNVAAVYVPKGKIIVNILNPADFTKLVRTQIQDAIEDQLKKSEGRDLVDLLMDIESSNLEFKASMWSSYHGTSGERIDNQESKNLSLEDSVVKTIAAFLNTGGGTLLIGVKDKSRSDLGTVAEVLGIEADYRWLKKGKRDTEGYEHTLLEILKNAFNNKAAAQIYSKISFPVYEDSTLCRVDVQPVPRNGPHNVVYTKTKTMGADKFFTRSGDSTISPSLETSYAIINDRFDHPRDRDQS
jgi:hypothetical protein